MTRIHTLSIGVVCAMILSTVALAGGNTAFTYQGQINQGGSPFNGNADIVVRLFDADTDGSELGSNSLPGTAVTNGLVTLELDFGAGQFTGSARWLEIEVDGNILAPRQQVLPVPYAMYAYDSPDGGGGLWSLAGADMFNLNPGKVGIGTPAPAALLDVNGDAVVAGDAFVAGFVGIGTPVPLCPLDVIGNAFISGSADVAGSMTIGSLTSFGRLDVADDGNQIAIFGKTIGGDAGVYGESNALQGRGVWGFSTGTGSFATGVLGSGVLGVRGFTSAPGGKGVVGNAGVNSAVGVEGAVLSETGIGVSGLASGSNDFNSIRTGVYGETDARLGFGVHALNTNNDGAAALRAEGPGGPGGTAIYATTTGNGFAINAQTQGGTAVFATSGNSGKGVEARGDIAVVGLARGATLPGDVFDTGVYGKGDTGVHGETNLNLGIGVRAEASGQETIGLYTSANGTDSWALQAFSGGSGSKAGLFVGSVEIDGALDVTGTLTKGAGSFKIDHPLDPARKYLYHSFVESPDMMNIYNGVLTTDDRGYATITMPEWFEALNRDFRYQLTIIDETDSEDFILVKVVNRIEDNTFTIRTSAPHVEVSWQVTGVRQDAFAEAHRIVVEEDKPESERGTYLYPQGFGTQPEAGVAYRGESRRE